jgi:hypothetical protein
MVTIEGLVRVERAERYDIEGPGTVRAASSLPSTVTIVNLSRSGCLFRGSVNPEVGSALSIGVPGLGARAATVVRIAAEGIGCAFQALLSEEELNHALGSTRIDVSDAYQVVRELRRRMPQEDVAPVANVAWWRRLSARR